MGVNCYRGMREIAYRGTDGFRLRLDIPDPNRVIFGGDGDETGVQEIPHGYCWDRLGGLEGWG